MERQKSTHVDSPSAVGERLRHARTQAGLSQRELAFPGCSPGYISRIEAGDRVPSLQLLRELAGRLGLSEDFLARGADVAAVDDPRLIDADLALRLDDLEVAERLYRDVLEASSTGRQRATALQGLGQLAFLRSDTPLAREYLEEALELIGEGPAPATLADTLGRTYAALGEYENAIALFEQAHAAAEERDDDVDVIRFSVLLANALVDSGRFGRAEELLGRALVRGDQLRDPVVRARLYWTQSRLHAQQGDADTAARYAFKALELIELTEDTHYIAQAHQLVAHIELDRGEHAEGLRLIRVGLELLGDTGNALEFHKFRLEEARALALLGAVEDGALIAMESAAALLEIHPLEAGRGYGYVAEPSRASTTCHVRESCTSSRRRRSSRYRTAIWLRSTRDSRMCSSAKGKPSKLSTC